jgi:hypothetical protein
MKKLSYFALFIIILAAACKQNKKNMLVGTWHAVDLQNPQMDLMLSEGQHFIDTVGSTTDAATNMDLYGTTNMDSFRKVARLKLDSVRDMQMQAVKGTMFQFRKDGIALLTFSGYPDSTKWYFDEEGKLVLDELQEKGAGANLKMDVEELSDTVLKLRFTENDLNSVVTFHPEKK